MKAVADAHPSMFDFSAVFLPRRTNRIRATQPTVLAELWSKTGTLEDHFQRTYCRGSIARYLANGYAFGSQIDSDARFVELALANFAPMLAWNKRHARNIGEQANG